MDSFDARLLGNSDIPPTFAALPQSSRQLLLSTYDWATRDIEHLCAAVLVAQAEYAKLPSNEAGSWFSRSYSMWRDIDNRVFRLLHYIRVGASGAPFAVTGQLRNDVWDFDIQSAENSDVDEDESETFFAELSGIFHSFSQMSTRSFIVVKPLDKSQRRHAHAVAHFSHFGHMSIGSGPLRMLLLSRRREDLAKSVKDAYRPNFRHRSQAPARPDFPQTGAVDYTIVNWAKDELFDPVSEAQGTQDPISALFTAWNQPDPYLASGYSSADSTGSASSLASAESSLSKTSAAGSHHSSTGKRRKREVGAYECSESGCSEVFDRQCDLAHHKRHHTPQEQRQFMCRDCEKRFLFPKDLRRHVQVHKKDKSWVGPAWWDQHQNEHTQPFVLDFRIPEED